MITRRAFLEGAAFTAAVAAMPSCVQHVIDLPPRRIEHVVLLMQENRSFDHYFGIKPGVIGFDDLDALPGVFKQLDPTHPDGFIQPWHLDTSVNSVQHTPSTSHAWWVQHAALNQGANDSWMTAHRIIDKANAPYVMGYFEQQDIPFHWALADAFTVCDAYHSSVLGPTWPNRMMFMTGTIDPAGAHGGPITVNETTPPGGYTWTTYPERLQRANITWRVYNEYDDYKLNILNEFRAYQQAPRNSALQRNGIAVCPVGQFQQDCHDNRLPTVSWIIPSKKECEHPDSRPADGAQFIADRLNAVAANPDLWSKTVFIICYDENDGMFDHVVPPAPPVGEPDEWVRTPVAGTPYNEPIGAGFRVPCFIVSPWTVGGVVTTQRYDHTSCLRLLENITGVTEPNISSWRRNTFGDLTTALRLTTTGEPRQFSTSAEVLRANETDLLPKPTI